LSDSSGNTGGLAKFVLFLSDERFIFASEIKSVIVTARNVAESNY